MFVMAETLLFPFFPNMVYFTYLGRTLAEPICPKICMWGDILEVITGAKFQNEILRGCDFTGVEISIFIDFGHYNCAALL